MSQDLTMTSQQKTHSKFKNKLNGMILMIYIALANVYLVSSEKPPHQPNKTHLVEKIRRQLMEDNYDYFPSEEELLTTVQHYEADHPNDYLHQDNDTLIESSRANAEKNERYDREEKYEKEERQEKLERYDKAHKYDETEDYKAERKNRAEESFEPKVPELKEDEKNDHAISKKDLFYYMDDDRLVGTTNNDVEEINDKIDDTNNKTPKVKYKVLKVRGQHPYRRSGNSYGRFVQEETEDGVALISLDGRPFPQFHLPRSRRQYMHEDSMGLEDRTQEANVTGLE